MIQINVAILYANTTSFTIVVGVKTHKHPVFRGNGQSEGFFFYGNELLQLHLSTNKDAFYSVHKPVKWTSLFVRGSQLHNILSSPRYVISAFGFVVRLHVQNMN